VRSISVQNSGPTSSTLPSGGRSGRKARERPEGLNLARLRGLHISDPEALSPPPESVASHGTVIHVGRKDPSSRYSMGLSSSSGSSNGSIRRRGISMKRPILYTPSITPSSSSGSSEERGSMIFNSVGVPTAHTSGGALVQIWQSRQTDPEASDIFSLGAIFLDIFTYLCKRKIAAFVSHRGAKNRTAGRGGGAADCSFHLDRNIGQVSSWITLLDSDAKKRKDPVFQAVRPMLAMSRDMVSREPGNRPSAFQVEQLFACSIRKAESKVALCCSSSLYSGHRGRPDGMRSAKDDRVAVPRIGSRSPSAFPRSPRKDQNQTKAYLQDESGLLSPSIPSTPGTYLCSSETESYTTSESDRERRKTKSKQSNRKQSKKKSSRARSISPDAGPNPVLANDPSWGYAIPWVALKN